MNWEEHEQNTSGQLDIPTLVETPTIAERAFIHLSRAWLIVAKKTPNDEALPRDADIMSLSCILLSVERGKTFTEVARNQMEENRVAAENRRKPSWADELPWKLCSNTNLVNPKASEAFYQLHANLDHHNSSIRGWMMEMAWVSFPFLNSEYALGKLFKNIADTLGGVDIAVGLASRFFSKPDDFMAAAQAFKPTDFEDQYQDRLKIIKENGVQSFQASLWKTETCCRKLIEETVMGLRMPKGTKPK